MKVLVKHGGVLRSWSQFIDKHNTKYNGILVVCQKRYKEKVLPTREKEKSVIQSNNIICIGIDEVGRGCLAGPVVAAACHIPLDISIDEIQDSKQLREKKRENIYEELTNHPEINFGFGVIEHQIIDQINIRQATLKAMGLAFDNLIKPIDDQQSSICILIDGVDIPQQFSRYDSACIKQGDKMCYCIAAASILAKVHRDRIMKYYHGIYTQYGFENHKGYPTRQHQQAIREFGPCQIHRQSFKLG